METLDLSEKEFYLDVLQVVHWNFQLSSWQSDASLKLCLAEILVTLEFRADSCFQ